MSSPAGFERFVKAVGETPPDLDRIAAIAAEYGIELLGPPQELP